MFKFWGEYMQILLHNMSILYMIYFIYTAPVAEYFHNKKKHRAETTWGPLVRYEPHEFLWIFFVVSICPPQTWRTKFFTKPPEPKPNEELWLRRF